MPTGWQLLTTPLMW